MSELGKNVKLKKKNKWAKNSNFNSFFLFNLEKIKSNTKTKTKPKKDYEQVEKSNQNLKTIHD